MPDMGYFPGSSRLFSDLMHYVRTGDFVRTLSDSARTVQEYAFALGALAHYTADRFGHPLGVNRAVPLVFPDLVDKHGANVSYTEDPVAHVRVEFGFDVLQTARGVYDTAAYRQFLDFQMADSLLARSLRASYGLGLESLFGDYKRSVNSFRWAVRELLPRLTKQAWRSRRDEILTRQPTATARRFRYRMRRAEFAHAYGKDFDRPGCRARSLAFLVRILPKVGPLKALKPTIPNPEAEAVFIRSFDTVAARYKQLAHSLASGAPLPDVNYDTGEAAHWGTYSPADDAHANLLLEHQKRDWAAISPALRSALLHYFSSKPIEDGEEPALEKALRHLRDKK